MAFEFLEDSADLLDDLQARLQVLGMTLVMYKNDATLYTFDVNGDTESTTDRLAILSITLDSTPAQIMLQQRSTDVLIRLGGDSVFNTLLEAESFALLNTDMWCIAVNPKSLAFVSYDQVAPEQSEVAVVATVNNVPVLSNSLLDTIDLYGESRALKIIPLGDGAIPSAQAAGVLFSNLLYDSVQPQFFRGLAAYSASSGNDFDYCYFSEPDDPRVYFMLPSLGVMVEV